MHPPLSSRQIAATVGITTAVQAFTALSLAVAPVLAPAVAPELGARAAQVGTLVAASFLFGIIAGLMSGTLIARYGPVGTFRISMLLAGVALAAAAGGSVPLVLAYSFVGGLAHGLVNPPASQVLMQAAPARLRALIFSIKQTGVPLGMALAGVLIPSMLLIMTWRQALLWLSLCSLLLLCALQPFRALYDRQRNPRAPLVLSDIVRPLKETLREPRLRDFVLCGGSFSFIQPCVTTYLVSLLHLELGYSLVAAGLVFSVASVAGVVGRMAWGALADWSRSARGVLAALGVLMAACSFAAGCFSTGWSPTLVTLICALWGASAVGWNGVYLAEVARLAPEGKVGMATSGAQAFVFSGAMLAPPLFGALSALTGGFSAAYLWVAGIPLISGLMLLKPARAAMSRSRVARSPEKL